MDVVYKNMDDDTEHVFSDQSQSQIEKFFAGKTIFLTGCTGFVGKCVVEKLLRSCQDIRAIYALVRPKRGHSIEQRMDRYFQEVIFEKCCLANPKYAEIVVPIAGDLVEPGLGISPEDRQMLRENVDIIIHNGATVYFDEKISKALRINVLATQKMLELAGECLHVKAFMYVSSGFSHCYETEIDEMCYPAPADLKMAEDMIRADEENAAGMNDSAVRSMIHPYPNRYTFTKGVAEGLVEAYGRKASFACCIFRPTIVASTYKEPMVGWTDNKNGPVKLIVGLGLGMVHVFPCRRDRVLDLVPVDMCVNALLAILWDVAEYRSPGETYVYNYGSSDVQPLNLYMLEKYCSPSSVDMPSIQNVWIFFIYRCQWMIPFYLLHLLFHMIPALLMDLALLCRLRKPFAFMMCCKVTMLLPVAAKFVNGDWRVQMKRMHTVWNRMNDADHEKFNSDLTRHSWADYLPYYWPGIRKYVLKESADTIPAAKKRWRRFYIIHKTIGAAIKLLALYAVYRILCRGLGF